MNNSVAVILAAGKGTRMKSDLAKVLFPVLGRPMVHYVLDALEQVGVQRKIVVVGYQADRVKAELDTRSSVEFALQAEQLGTGHAVQMCRGALEGHTGPVIVVTGDSPLLQPQSLEKLLLRYQQHRPSALLGTLLKSDPAGLGRIVRALDGSFERIVEQKDATPQQQQIREVNMSTYVFHGPDLLVALDRLRNNNAQREYYLTDVPAILLEMGKTVEALPVLQDCESLSINTPEELSLVEEKMRSLGYGQVT